MILSGMHSRPHTLALTVLLFIASSAVTESEPVSALGL
jgi:hypothetical protein